MGKKIDILSTRPLADDIISMANQRNIAIDVHSFIVTEPIVDVETLQEIEAVLLLSTNVVFTSMNAVEAVAAQLNGVVPDWRIYSIGYTTRQLIAQYFGEESIMGVADNAKDLANLILAEEEITTLVFFCGDQRRDELPEILQAAQIEVQEVIVYQTIAVPQKLAKHYQGILFFSPSAVQSFFTLNKADPQTVFFAIGSTTATEIATKVDNKIIVATAPGKLALVQKAIGYFNGE